MSEPAPITGGLRTTGTPGVGTPVAGRELFVRHARKDGRSVAILRAIDYGDSCQVEAEVYPEGGRNTEVTRPGPYTFANAHQATAFVTEAVEALMVLGCDVHAQ
jgi:hypothetical protein